MPRKARVIVPNCPHHIVQRGHNRRAVFVEDGDYYYYLNTLKEWKRELEVKVYAFCLMTNHVHLVVDLGGRPESISLLMKRLAGRQTRYVNKLEGRSGTLWEGRYKISPIETDGYLLQCCRYVELNPVKAKMVTSAEDYYWSSYATKIGVDRFDWVDLDPCYMALMRPAESYKAFVEESICPEEQEFLSEAVARSQVTGSSQFTDEIERRTGVRIQNRRPGRPGK